MADGDVEVFISQWGLDGGSRALVGQLPEDIKRQVLEGFAPKPNTQNLDRLLQGFVRSIQNRVAAQELSRQATIAAPPSVLGLAPGQHWDMHEEEAPQAQDEIAAFVQQWGLDETCAGVLLSQSPEVQRLVLATFLPKQGTRNVNSLFMGFLRSITDGRRAASTLDGQIAAGGSTLEAKVAVAPVSDEELVSFLQHWELDEECGAYLRSYQAEVARDVMARFCPKPGTRNVKSLFMGFLKSVATGPSAHGATTTVHPPPGLGSPSEQEISQFSAQWGLDSDAIAALVSSPPEVQREVVDNFQPKADTFNVKSLFMGFLRSRSSLPRAGAAGPRPMPMAAAPPSVEVQRAVRDVMPAYSPGGLASGGVGGGGGYAAAGPPGLGSPTEQEISHFSEHWGLDSDAIAALVSAAPEVQREVVDSFQPKADTFNVKSLFMGFLRSRASRPRGAPRPVPSAAPSVARVEAWSSFQPEAPSTAAWPSMPPAGIHTPAAYEVATEGVAAGGVPGAPADHEIAQFADFWGLDSDATAALLSHSPEVQRDVMYRFKPKSGTYNVKNLFMGFLKSRAFLPTTASKRPRLI